MNIKKIKKCKTNKKSFSFFLLFAFISVLFSGLFLVSASPALASVISIDKETTFRGIATVGDEIDYTITVNSGRTLKNVVVNDDLISNLSGPAGDNGDNKLQSSETWVYTGIYTVTENDICAPIVNTAIATALWDYYCNNQAGPVEDTVEVPTTYTAEIAIDKETTFSGIATAGDKIDYTITVTNIGNVSVSDVTVNDLKLGIENDTSIGSLSPGESGTINDSYIVAENDLCADILNTATAVANDFCGKPVSLVEDSLALPTVCSGSISGYKYNDLNGNGQGDDNEPGIEDWTIFIDENSNGSLDAGEISTTTINDGSYLFDDVASGNYTVCEVLRNGWTRTSPIQNNGCYRLTILAGQELAGYDFRNFENGKISGSKFNDLNGNGVWDVGEPAMDGWQICVKGECVITGDGDWVDGYYEFSGLAPGEYTLTEILKTGWIQTQSPQSPFTLVSGQNLTDLNFGNRGDLSISGFKYNDLNGNGAYDQVEPGIEGWKITLGKDKTDTTLTDNNGHYCFSNLEPGNYTVTEETRTDWTATSVNTINVILGETSSSANNFFNFKKASISGSKFNDLNGNGVWDEGEPALNGWQICIKGGTCALTGDGLWSDGYYEFTNLGPGVYTIEETLQAGWTQTAGPSSPITVVSGQNVSSVNFGNRGSLSICGYKYNDLNGNGILDQGEPGIEGWKMTLGGSKSGSTLTDKNGYYCFGNLQPGNYTVAEETRADWIATSPSAFYFGGITKSQTVNFFNSRDPVLEILKTNNISTFINPGGKVIYTIKVTNTGGGAAINFNVYDALPAGFSYINGSSVILGANGSGPTLSDNVLIWTVERLNLSSSFTISYEALTDKGILAGIYFNTASVMNKSDDSSVEVRVPMVLAESTQKGKVLGASVKTGLSFWNLVLLNFFLILIIYCIGISIRLKFREKFRFHRESSTKSGPAPILPS